jgi:DNA-binding transcriptional ArsR family regulator
VKSLILKKVLKCIHEKGYITVDEISRELSLSKSLVEYAAQKLKELEYLKVVIPLNGEAYCSFCPLKFTCHIKTVDVVKSYILTEKGRKLLEKAV